MVFLMNTTDTPSLHYLQEAVKGGLSLHPPIPITRRLCGDGGCKIGESGLPEETAALINLYSISRDPEAWDNPDESCPERFLVCPVEQGNEMETKKGQNFGFVLFGGGRRRCPGAKLAFILMNTTVAAMVQCLFGRLVQMTNAMMQEKSGMTIHMANLLRYYHYYDKYPTFTLYKWNNSSPTWYKVETYFVAQLVSFFIVLLFCH